MTQDVASALIQNVVGLFFVFEKDKMACLPGGLRKFGEKPGETAVREAFEEAHLKVHVEKLVALYNLTVFNPDGTERCRFLHYLFLASTRDSKPQPSPEWSNLGAECSWITLEDLRGYKKVWPLPEKVRNQISKGILDLGNLGELRYQMI